MFIGAFGDVAAMPASLPGVSVRIGAHAAINNGHDGSTKKKKASLSFPTEVPHLAVPHFIYGGSLTILEVANCQRRSHRFTCRG
jgi:hypothetical protein